MRDELDDDSPFASNTRTLISIGVIVLVGAVASSSGVGGGAIFIPLLNALVGFNLKSSTSLSQACITCGAAASLAANLLHHHPSDPRVALVDFTLAAVMTPILLMGVGIGVMLNVMLPSWLLTGLLLVLLALLITQTTLKGRALWLQESSLRSRHQHALPQQHGPQHGQLCQQPTANRQPSEGAVVPGTWPSWSWRRKRRPGSRAAGDLMGTAGTTTAALREPLLLGVQDGGGGGAAAAAGAGAALPRSVSPRRCLTPAPTAIWHVEDFEGDDGEGEAVGAAERHKDASAAQPGEDSPGGPAPAAAQSPGWTVVAANEARGVRVVRQGDGHGGDGLAAAAVTAAEAVAVVSSVQYAPAGPEDTCAPASRPPPEAAAAAAPEAQPPSTATTATATATATHGSRAVVPTAVSPSPFRRQSVPRSASTGDTSAAAAAGAASVAVPTSAAAGAAAGGNLPTTTVGGASATVPVAPAAAAAAATVPGIAAAAAPATAPRDESVCRVVAAEPNPLPGTTPSPEAAAAFAEALAAALAAAAASSSSSADATWSPPWMAAATSLFALAAAPTWRAFNELGAVYDDSASQEDDPSSHGDDGEGQRRVAGRDAGQEHPAAADSPTAACVDTSLGSSPPSVTPCPPGLQSVVVVLDRGTGREGRGGGHSGGGGGGGGGASPAERSPEPPRLRGLPGSQLSRSGRSSPSAGPDHPRSGSRVAASARKLAAGPPAAAKLEAETLRYVNAAAAAAAKRRLSGGGGAAAAAPPPVPPLNTPDRTEGSRPASSGSPSPPPLSSPPPPPRADPGLHSAPPLPATYAAEPREGQRQGHPASATATATATSLTAPAAMTPRLGPQPSKWPGVRDRGASPRGAPVLVVRQTVPPAHSLPAAAPAADEATPLLSAPHPPLPRVTFAEGDARRWGPGGADRSAAAAVANGGGGGGSGRGGAGGRVAAVTTTAGPTASPKSPRQQRRGDPGLMAALRRIPLTPVLALAVAWGLYFGLQLLRSRLTKCSPLWWCLAAAQALGMGALSVGALLAAAAPPPGPATSTGFFAFAARRRTTRRRAGGTEVTTFEAAAAIAAATAVATPPPSSSLPTTPTAASDRQRQQLAVVLRAPVVVLTATCVAGLAGGLLGLGGGMVMGPLLLHLGVHPQVTAATSGAMVLFSSSAALAQFALMGRLNIQYAAVFGAASAAASVAGSLLLSRLVRRSGRPSLVVLALAAVMASGAACVALFGVRAALEDLRRGGPSGLAALCDWGK